ncbi:MAG: ISL3 family transposase [Candidatus Thiodiazotropha sp. (ex Lucinoma aequizonata)]|nr:ISL3 family transposase [Candidatus Thiodiazotropha sp. (ex Lucinoma aequizonata)]
MRDKDLYAQILGIKSPWQVTSVELAVSDGNVTVHVEQKVGTKQCCPTCGEISPGYDTRKRSWRHLDTCQYKTILVADTPRVECKEHGVVTVSVPWAEPGTGFTAMFEALVIDWLKEASISAVSRLMGLSWNAIDGIMQRAVKRGLARREEINPTHIGVDETAFRKRHDYVTVVSDQDTGTVLHVGKDRKKATLKEWYSSLTEEQREAIESVSMEMWPAFINATLESLPGAEEKIAFDKFYVAKYLGEAVDKVRRQEHKALMSEGYEDLKWRKYDWLYNPHNMTHKQKLRFKSLRESTLKTARRWAIKELAISLWHYVSKTWAQKGWDRWLSWAVRSRLDPIKEVAKTIKVHLWEILNAVVLKVSNGPAEGLNSRIKMIKFRSRGFRNKERFANAIYFHLGGLVLYPEGVVR